jgi:hypothetical protein
MRATQQSFIKTRIRSKKTELNNIATLYQIKATHQAGVMHLPSALDWNAEEHKPNGSNPDSHERHD